MSAASREPDLVWHYTNAEGLIGILESDALWASGAVYMNDPEEVETGLRILANRAREAAPRISSDLSRVITEYIEETRDALPNTFIASTTGNHNSLSMWRDYGKSNSGAFAIGIERTAPLVPQNASSSKNILYRAPEACFDGPPLVQGPIAGVSIDAPDDFDDSSIDPFQIALSDGQTWQRVVYTKNDAESFVDGLLKDLINAHNFTEVEGRGYFSPHQILSQINFVNSEHYQPEDEWRIVWSAPQTFTNSFIRHRSTNYGLTQYISLCHFDGQRFDRENTSLVRNPLPIRRIVVGPSVYQEQSFSSLGSLLHVNGYFEVEVEVSPTRVR